MSCLKRLLGLLCLCSQFSQRLCIMHLICWDFFFLPVKIWSKTPNSQKLVASDTRLSNTGKVSWIEQVTLSRTSDFVLAFMHKYPYFTNRCWIAQPRFLQEQTQIHTHFSRCSTVSFSQMNIQLSLSSTQIKILLILLCLAYT